MLELPEQRNLIINIERGHDKEPFSRSDRALLQRLQPHILRVASFAALRLHDRAAIAVDVLSAMNALAFVIDEDRTVIASTQALRAHRAGRFFEPGALLLLGPAAMRALMQAAFPPRAQEGDGPDPGGDGTLMLRLPEDDAVRTVRVIPLVQRTPFARRSALFVLSGTRAEPTTDTTSLARRFGLTDTEAELTGMLARGLSVRAIATARGISPGTVRWHLKSVFAKLGVHRQTELVRLVLGAGPPDHDIEEP